MLLQGNTKPAGTTQRKPDMPTDTAQTHGPTPCSRKAAQIKADDVAKMQKSFSLSMLNQNKLNKRELLITLLYIRVYKNQTDIKIIF